MFILKIFDNIETLKILKKDLTTADDSDNYTLSRGHSHWFIFQ